MIPKFSNLKILIIGPGTSGAWIPIKVKNIIKSKSVEFQEFQESEGVKKNFVSYV